MIYIFTILIIILAIIVDKIRKVNIERKISEINDKEIIEANRKNEEKCFVIKKIVKDRICKYQDQIWFVVTESRLLKLVWSEKGDNLEFVNTEDINYQDIELEDDIRKNDKEYLMYGDVKDMLINIFDIILPDVKELKDSIEKTQRSINIAKNMENGSQYVQLMDKYLFTMVTLLNKALDIYDKYKYFIKEIFAQYEIENFESTMDISLIEKNIDYKSIEDNLNNQYKDYSSYRKIYEELSKELKGTL